MFNNRGYEPSAVFSASPMLNNHREYDYLSGHDDPDHAQAAPDNNPSINNGAGWVRRIQPDNLYGEFLCIKPVGLTELEIQRRIEQMRRDKQEFQETGRLPVRILIAMQEEEERKAHAAHVNKVLRRQAQMRQISRDGLKAMKDHERAKKRADYVERMRAEREQRRESHARKREAVRQTSSKRAYTVMDSIYRPHIPPLPTQ